MTRFAADILTAHAVPDDTARTTARHMLWADRRGTETHGLVRLPAYASRIRQGTLDPRARPRVESRQGAAATIDAGHGLGHVACDHAMTVAVDTARQGGLGAAAVRRSGHFGAAGAYAEIAAHAGMIGIAMTNAAPLMAPTGGSARRVGNNPIAVAVPFDEFPIVLDIAMSAVAAGHIMLAAGRGEPIPEQWGLDAEGRPTTDPDDVLRGGGFLRPLGDHKGYGLALIVDLLTGVLAGGAPGAEVKRLDQDGPVDASHTCIAIDPRAFGDPEAFHTRVRTLAATMRATPRAPGTPRILLPGEREAETARDRDTRGIPYPADIIAALEPLAADAGVPLPAPEGEAAPAAEAGR